MILSQVQDLVQEDIMAAIDVNPLWTSPWADDPESPKKDTAGYC